MIIHHLVAAGCMDEREMEALKEKGATQDSILGVLKARIREIREGKEE